MSISEDRDELLYAHQQANEAMINLAQKTREAQQAAEPTSAELMRTRVASNSSITIKNGIMETASGGTATAMARSPSNPNMVTLPNGMTTTVEAAKAAGFDFPGDASDHADQPRSFDGGSADAHRQTPDNEGQEAAPLDGVSADETYKINIARAMVAHGERTIGAFAVQSMQEDVVASGELPRHLPEGVTTSQVNVIADGFVAQANAVLRPTGASVETLRTFLEDNELREARLATFRGDDTKLQELGGRAMERLLRLPNDPARFNELTSEWGPDVKITRRGNAVFVKAPAWSREMSWEDCVKSGKVRL